MAIKNHRPGRFKSGDHLVLCQRTGRTVYASECVREWNGLLVHKSVYEPKHPLLMVRTRTESPAPTFISPEPADTYVGSDYVNPDYWEISYTGMS